RPPGRRLVAAETAAAQVDAAKERLDDEDGEDGEKAGNDAGRGARQESDHQRKTAQQLDADDGGGDERDQDGGNDAVIGDVLREGGHGGKLGGSSPDEQGTDRDAASGQQAGPHRDPAV